MTFAEAILIASFVILFTVALVLVRALAGPTVHDRILAVNLMGTKTVVFLALVGAVGGRTGYLDIALLYALLNYIGTIAILKLIQYRRLS
ncbi:MAG: monovalent cation/H+ antiporter complex subunit F [Planctomycetota bacterium]